MAQETTGLTGFRARTRIECSACAVDVKEGDALSSEDFTYAVG